MRNAEYWQRRFEILEAAQRDKARVAQQEIERQFILAQREIERDIRAWYVRFAENNQISLADARKWLIDDELAEFRWDVHEYIRRGIENTIDGRWAKELENASARVHISRLEALKIQTRNSLEKLYGAMSDEVNRLVEQTYKDGYYRTAYEIQKGVGEGWTIAAIDERRLEKVMSKPWTPDSKTFSKRIWGDYREILVDDLHKLLTQGLILGRSPKEAIDVIANKFKTSKSNASRLVMTESAYFASLAQNDAFKELNVERYEFHATLDKDTCKLCGEMDGMNFKLSEFKPGENAPPLHAWCRCTTVPYFEDDVGERVARGNDGKTYYVLSDMSYKHWYSKHVEPSAITKYDKEVILRYVGGGAYVLNDKLREGIKLTRDERDWASRLDVALDKLPTHGGLITRTLVISEDRLQKYLNEHRIGNDVKYLAFTSFSKSSLYNPTANVQVYVESASGKDVSAFNPGEQEVLYPRGSSFTIKEMESISGVTHLLLEEV